jgi:hypothetical protein
MKKLFLMTLLIPAVLLGCSKNDSNNSAATTSVSQNTSASVEAEDLKQINETHDYYQGLISYFMKKYGADSSSFQSNTHAPIIDAPYGVTTRYLSRYLYSDERKVSFTISSESYTIGQLLVKENVLRVYPKAGSDPTLADVASLGNEPSITFFKVNNYELQITFILAYTEKKDAVVRFYKERFFPNVCKPQKKSYSKNKLINKKIKELCNDKEFLKLID